MLKVNIITPKKLLFSGDAKYVSVPTETGTVGIYSKHQPMLSLVSPGEIRIESEVGKITKVYVEKDHTGFLQVDSDEVSITISTELPNK